MLLFGKATWIAQKGVFMEGRDALFFNEEAAVEGLAKGIFEDNILQSKDLSQIWLPEQNTQKYSQFKKKQKILFLAFWR